MRRPGPLLWLLLYAPLVVADSIQQEAAVRFNTTCARCHEGQCSGCLSLGSNSMAVADHVRRHAGEVHAKEVGDLHALLAYMKKKCAFYPMRVPVPIAGVWSASMLAPLRNPAGGAYFIPLGELVAGVYRVRMSFDATTEVVAQVVSSHFDISDYPGLKTRDSVALFEFEVDRGIYYLRLYPSTGAALDKLDLQSLR